MSEEALQVAEEREAKGKGERERYTQLNAEFQRIARILESLPQRSMQRNKKKTTEWERLESSSRKSEILREHFMQRWS